MTSNASAWGMGSSSLRAVSFESRSCAASAVVASVPSTSFVTVPSAA